MTSFHLPHFLVFAVCRRLWLLPVLALALLGCSAVPPGSTPAVPVSTTWKNPPPAGWINTADHPPAWEDGRWWALFQDDMLDGLMAEVQVGNQNLALAAANVAQAEALLRQAQARRFPTLDGGLSTQRSGDPARGSASLQLSASWAPDLWGRVDAAVRAQGANVQARKADLAAARLSVQAGLATAYLAVRENDAELHLLDEIIAGYVRALEITQNRYDSGIAARADLLQAQTTLENTRASRTALQGARDRSEQAIAVLLGRAPADFTLAPADWRVAVPEVPLDLPSGLLLRRPDIAAAERAVVAANANIGAAQAAFFPSLNLSAAVGGGASSLAGLASAPALAWSLGAALAQTLFDAGSRKATVDEARAAHAAATARYRQIALTAMQEVEDQLVALRTLAGQLEHQKAAAQAAAQAEERILNRYQAGLAAYTEVVTAQAASLSARRSLLQLELQRQQATVALIQALGGGWQVPWAGTE